MANTFRVNAFTRFGDTMAAAMIRLGIAPAGMHVLAVRGRKSGLPRTTTVKLIEHEGRHWLVAPYGEVPGSATSARQVRSSCAGRARRNAAWPGRPPPTRRCRSCGLTCGSSGSS